MTDTEYPSHVPPRAFGPAGTELWAEFVAELRELNLELTATERVHLANAARLADRAALLEDELDGADQVTAGSRNQEVVNPLIPELRSYCEAIDRALARIKVSEPEEPASGRPRDSGSVAPRAAALARWKRGA